jgi:hypothetical protein
VLTKCLYAGKNVAKVPQLESTEIWSDKRFSARETSVKLRKFYSIIFLFSRIKRSPLPDFSGGNSAGWVTDFGTTVQIHLMASATYTSTLTVSAHKHFYALSVAKEMPVRVEEVYSTSTVALQVAEGDEEGTQYLGV